MPDNDDTINLTLEHLKAIQQKLHAMQDDYRQLRDSVRDVRNDVLSLRGDIITHVQSNAGIEVRLDKLSDEVQRINTRLNLND